MATEFDEYLARRILREMESAGISRHEMADRLRQEYSTVTTWLRGERRISAEALHDIADVLGCSMDKLAGRENHEERID